MDKKEIQRLAENPRFISGMYTYCDRWCERCPMTHNCLTYAIEMTDNDIEKAHDITNINVLNYDT